MKKEPFNPKKCVTCPHCSTYPVYKDHVVYCPNCGFKVELKPYHEPVQHWDKAVLIEERKMLAKKTVLSKKSYSKSLKDNARSWNVNYADMRDDDGIIDPDGFYYDPCSERQSRIRLGFYDAAQGHYHRDNASYDDNLFDEEQ